MENLRSLGLEFDLIKIDDYILYKIDSDISYFLHTELQRSQVQLSLKTKVEKITKVGIRSLLHPLTKRFKYYSDIIIIAFNLDP